MTMKKLLLSIATLMATLSAQAIEDNVVAITYNGSTATIEIASNVASYVNCTSGTSSHVKLIQSSTTTKNPGEIIYQLSGSSSDGEFYMEGEFKATVQLSGLTLTNPDSTAINIKDGKRIKVSLANGTENTIEDGTRNADSKGCFRSKGHTEFVGKGTLNVKSNFNHAIYSKEYIELKNCTINVKGAKKDAIHCQQYFRMASGVVNISQADDDGVQVELKGETPTAGTGDEDEDTGNFYMAGGTLTRQMHQDRRHHHLYRWHAGFRHEECRAERRIWHRSHPAAQRRCRGNPLRFAGASAAKGCTAQGYRHHQRERRHPESDPLNRTRHSLTLKIT